MHVRRIMQKILVFQYLSIWKFAWALKSTDRNKLCGKIEAERNSFKSGHQVDFWITYCLLLKNWIECSPKSAFRKHFWFNFMWMCGTAIKCKLMMEIFGSPTSSFLQNGFTTFVVYEFEKYGISKRSKSWWNMTKI